MGITGKGSVHYAGIFLSILVRHKHYLSIFVLGCSFSCFGFGVFVFLISSLRFRVLGSSFY